MWHQFWIPVLIPTLIVKSNCDDNNNKTDTVFLRYGGHAEANGGYRDATTVKTTVRDATTTVATTVYAERHPLLETGLPQVSPHRPVLCGHSVDSHNPHQAAGTPCGRRSNTASSVETEPPTTTKLFEEEATEDVVFVPNNAPPDTRDDDEYLYDGRGLRVKDIMMMKSVRDAMDKDFHVEKNAESAKEDIVFITGKNHDFEKTKPEDNTRRRNNNNYQKEDIEEEINAKPKLNCRNLDCNNTINSVCGAKYINNEWKYRLFLNDCYFRKVNCGLKYEINRYQQVEVDRCKNIGAHFGERPFSFKPRPYVYKPELPPKDTRRSSSSRRSMSKNLNGDFCSHPCPVTCTDDYDPECAISGTGQQRVFLNHCKLDLNSCFYSVVWHKRPLSECVGGKKADMRENRGFIGWMQRVGIVDKKGRLVLE